MVIYDKNIKEISMEDLETIIKESVIENKFLEFKGQMNMERDKILKTICGFANGDGGLFVYGLNEIDGKPVSLTGICLKDEKWDDKKRQIQDWIKTGIEPRLNVEIEILKLNDEKSIILIKVPKSWYPPHCVKNKNQRIFYSRRDGFTDSMEFDELRRMFDLNNGLVDNINYFRDKRIRKFKSENQGCYSVIFHAVPLNAFSSNQINLEKAKEELGGYEIIGRYYHYNFEGLYNPNDTFFRQVYRNGIYEMYYTSKNQNECIPVKYFEEYYLKFAEEIYIFYRKLNILCPIVFFISLTNVYGHDLCTNSLPRIHRIFDNNRIVLNPSGIVIENENQIENEVNNLFIPIWNHFGIPKEYK